MTVFAGVREGRHVPQIPSAPSRIYTTEYRDVATTIGEDGRRFVSRACKRHCNRMLFSGGDTRHFVFSTIEIHTLRSRGAPALADQFTNATPLSVSASKNNCAVGGLEKRLSGATTWDDRYSTTSPNLSSPVARSRATSTGDIPQSLGVSRRARPPSTNNTNIIRRLSSVVVVEEYPSPRDDDGRSNS